MTPTEIAHICHEANRAVQVIQADPTIPVSKHWDDLDAETRGSAIDGVMNALAGATPEESHANWMAYKIDHGWTLGPTKNETTKQHPLLVPYAELPAAQQLKDAVFLAIVTALASTVDPADQPVESSAERNLAVEHDATLYIERDGTTHVHPDAVFDKSGDLVRGRIKITLTDGTREQVVAAMEARRG